MRKELMQGLNKKDLLEYKVDLYINGVSFETIRWFVLTACTIVAVMFYPTNINNFFRFLLIGGVGYFLLALIEKTINVYVMGKIDKEYMERLKKTMKGDKG